MAKQFYHVHRDGRDTGLLVFADTRDEALAAAVNLLEAGRLGPVPLGGSATVHVESDGQRAIRSALQEVMHGDQDS